MSDQLTPFHAELLEYIRRDVEQRKIDEGYDNSYDLSFQKFQTDLANAFKRDLKPQGLAEIIDQYNFLIGTRGAILLELKLLQSFLLKEFAQLGLAAYYPRIYRGLPRLYFRERPSLSRVKTAFAHLPTLKKCMVQKALFSLYSAYQPEAGRVVLFTWVIGDGFGDWVAAREIGRILEEAFPQLEIDYVALIPKRYEGLQMEGERVVFYEGDCPLSLFNEEQWRSLKSADLVLQTPTFYPHTNELMRVLEKEAPFVKFEHLGEYGYVESGWFHPKSGGYSMGLHFLEKGILTRKIPHLGFAGVENRLLLQWLFNGETPGPAEVEQYERKNHFYLAYLSSPLGGKMYLHALLKSLERDEKSIDICTPHLGWFIEHLEECKRLNISPIHESLKVGRIEVWQEDRVYSEKLISGGKVVRILSPGTLSQRDFQALLSVSGEFVAVRGNQSFSEVVSMNKAFFYDCGPHGRYFVKDLAALGECRTASHRGTLASLRLMTRGILSQLPNEEGAWVDEVYFQQEEPFDWFDASQTIGVALQDGDTIAGFKKLNRIMAEELSCNPFILHLVQRFFAHKQDPVMSYYEEKQLDLFITDHQSFKSLIENMRIENSNF